MKLRTILPAFVAAFYASTAPADVIVNKTFRQTPFSDSLGIDGIYKFETKGADGKVHRRLVTAEVYNRYDIGQDFSDRLLPMTGPIGAIQIARAQAVKPAPVAIAAAKPSKVSRGAIAATASPAKAPAQVAKASASDRQLAEAERKLVAVARTAKHQGNPADDAQVAKDEQKLVQTAMKKSTAKAQARERKSTTMAFVGLVPLQDMQPDSEGY